MNLSAAPFSFAVYNALAAVAAPGCDHGNYSVRVVILNFIPLLYLVTRHKVEALPDCRRSENHIASEYKQSKLNRYYLLLEVNEYFINILQNT